MLPVQAKKGGRRKCESEVAVLDPRRNLTSAAQRSAGVGRRLLDRKYKSRQLDWSRAYDIPTTASSRFCEWKLKGKRDQRSFVGIRSDPQPHNLSRTVLHHLSPSTSYRSRFVHCRYSPHCPALYSPSIIELDTSPPALLTSLLPIAERSRTPLFLSYSISAVVLAYKFSTVSLSRTSL